MAYVYAHQRKDNGKCFYIGKGKGKRAFSDEGRNNHWHSVVKKHGFDVIILVDNISDEKALELEKSFIKQIGLENLSNMHPGGQGGWSHVQNDEIFAKRGKSISKAKKGIAPPCAYRDKRGHLNSNAKKVLWVEKNKVFNTANECREYFNISFTAFSRVIRGKKAYSNGRVKKLDNVTLKYIK